MTPEHGLPPVAIALVNWNGWRDTLGCLESLDRLRYPDPGVILCDNASTDESVERIATWARARGWSTRVVEHDVDGAEPGVLVAGEPRLLIARSQRNRGFAGGTNVAIRYAQASSRGYKYAWALNTDTTVEADSLAELVRVMEAHPRAGSGQSLLVWAREPTLLDSAGLRLLRRGGATDILHHEPRTVLESALAGTDVVEIFGSCGAAALYRLEALTRLGLFDESLFQTHEDVDLACRLRDGGYTAMLCPSSVVYHIGGVSRDRKKRGRSWWAAHRNKLRIVARWYPRSIAMPILMVGMARALIAALRGSDISLRTWAALPALLWAEWRGGATGEARRRVMQAGSAKMIV